MNSCPSREELSALLAEQVSEADVERLATHLDDCQECREIWDALTGVLPTSLDDCRQITAASFPEFLKRLQEHLPDELLSLELQDNHGRTPIQFPGPPTLLGKLGQLEHFHMRQELGHGATGIVFLAWDEKLDRAVAIKVLRPESLSNDRVRTRFEEEARRAGGLSHDHIIKVYEIRRIPDFPPYIVMEYVEGESLAQLIERKKTLEPKEAARIILQVSEGLSAAHGKRLVHLDIKPSNLLLKKADSTQDQLGSTIITDFGLARTTVLQDEGLRGRRDLSGETLGTPDYMSPEQIANPKSVNECSDLFSLGAVLYELLTGRPPFQAATTQDTLRMIRFEEPHAPRRLNASIPRDLETICLKCLEKEPRKRFQKAWELTAELKLYLEGLPIKTRPIGSGERVWRWLRRNPKVAVTGSVAVAALIAAVAVSIAFVLTQLRELREAQLRETNLTLEKGLALCERGDGGQGMLWLARSLEMAPADAVDLQRLIRENLAGWYLHLSPLKAIIEQQDEVLAVAFSSDGHTFVTGNADGTAQLWDTTTFQAKGKPFQHKASVVAAAFSPDGKTILTGCGDGSARLWNIDSGKLACPPLPHQDRKAVLAVGFSPDGKTLFSASVDKRAILWEASSGKRVGKPLRHDGMVLSLAISRNGKTIVTGGVDGKAQPWNVASQEPIGKPFAHKGPVWAVSFSLDDKTIVTATENEALQWELANRERPLGEPLRHRSLVRRVAFSRDGRTILTGSDDGTSRLWDAASGRPLGAPLRHAGKIRSVALSPDSTLILTGSADGSARLWQANSAQHFGLRLPHGKAVWAVSFSPTDGKTALTGSRDGTARLWDVVTGRPLGGPLTHSADINAVAFSPDGKAVLTGSDDKTAKLWDAQTGKPLLHFALPHKGEVSTVAFSPDSKTIVTGAFDHMVRVWHVGSGRLIALCQHEKDVYTVVFNSDGKKILTASGDGRARLWDAATGKLLASFPHRKAVAAAAISPDDKTVLTGSYDETAQLWDAVTGEPHGPPLQHHGTVYAVAFSPNGSTAVTASADHSARLWKVADGTPIGAPLEHLGAVRSATFTKDGHLVLTGSEDKTARLWDVATAKPVGPPFQNTSKVRTAVVSPNGKVILAGTDDDACIWNLPAPLRGPLTEVVLWTQVLTSMELDKTGVAHPLKAGIWQQRRRVVDQLGESFIP